MSWIEKQLRKPWRTLLVYGIVLNISTVLHFSHPYGEWIIIYLAASSLLGLIFLLQGGGGWLKERKEGKKE